MKVVYAVEMNTLEEIQNCHTETIFVKLSQPTVFDGIFGAEYYEALLMGQYML